VKNEVYKLFPDGRRRGKGEKKKKSVNVFWRGGEEKNKFEGVSSRGVRVAKKREGKR